MQARGGKKDLYVLATQRGRTGGIQQVQVINDAEGYVLTRTEEVIVGWMKMLRN